MKGFFRTVRVKMEQWMSGRYGFDELSRFISFVALVVMIASCFEPLHFLYIPAFVLWGYALFRCYSRNLARRQAERTWYINIHRSIHRWIGMKKQAWKERKTHRYFRCSGCKATLRVPKGKGTIRIHCPHCGLEIIKKT